MSLFPKKRKKKKWSIPLRVKLIIHFTPTKLLHFRLQNGPDLTSLLLIFLMCVVTRL